MDSRKHLFITLITATLFLVSTATPTDLPPSIRQELPLTIPVEPIMPEESVQPPEPEPVALGPIMIETPITVPESEIPIPSMEEEGQDMELSSSPAPDLDGLEPVMAVPMTEFAYNIGGGEYGMFAADPVEWAVGETSSFEVDTAAIVGDDEYAEVYKSHRYGILGSTWGYDIPVADAGMYDCTFYYAETYDGNFSDEPNRTFTLEVSGNGSEEVQSAEFDVMVELKGAEFTAYQREVKDIAVATVLRIRETPSVGDAFLSGIKCMKTAPLMMA